ncbi:cysteine desulfurase NifS [Candidatus Margulisiibacteriota bacterium]
MNKKRTVYLDHNATTYTDSRVIKAMEPYFTKEYGNPSSVYRSAQKNKQKIEEAREAIKNILHAPQDSKLIFTGNGSESDNLAIKGIAYANKQKGKHIITSQTEHHAVLHTCQYLEKQGFEVTYAPVNNEGIVDVDFIHDALRDDTILISIMYANNETGVIQPIEYITQIAHNKNVLLHTDAVQVVGKKKINIESLGVDLLTMSAHKFYGPKGVGALYMRKGIKIDPQIHGGDQEFKLRAGTENIAGIIGMTEALKIADKECEEKWKKEKEMRDGLEKGLLEKIPDCIVNGHREKRLANTLNIIVQYVEGESMLLHLDDAGIAASSGSACTSGSLDPSHVLLAMGISAAIAHGSLRFSFGKVNTMNDVKYVLEILPPIVEKLRAMSPFGKEKEDIENIEGLYDPHHEHTH